MDCIDLEDHDEFDRRVRYRIVVIERDGQWVAHAERADNGDRFGIECAGASARRSGRPRCAAGSTWQHEHAAALEDLQRAEHAYHRTIAGSAFASPSRGTERHRAAEGVARSGRSRPDPAGRDSRAAARMHDPNLDRMTDATEKDL